MNLKIKTVSAFRHLEIRLNWEKTCIYNTSPPQKLQRVSSNVIQYGLQKKNLCTTRIRTCHTYMSQLKRETRNWWYKRLISDYNDDSTQHWQPTIITHTNYRQYPTGPRTLATTFAFLHWNINFIFITRIILIHEIIIGLTIQLEQQEEFTFGVILITTKSKTANWSAILVEAIFRWRKSSWK